MSDFQIAGTVKTETKSSNAANVTGAGYRHISQGINQKKKKVER